MKTIQISCDGCEKDITYVGLKPDFRLCLTCEQLNHERGFIFAINVCPEILRSYHFCDLTCLKNWLKIYKNHDPQDSV